MRRRPDGARRAGRQHRGMRFRPRVRKVVLTVHVATSVGWLGAEAVLLVLAVAGLRGADAAVGYPAAGLIGVRLVAPLSVAAWAVGLVNTAVSTFKPWGRMRAGTPTNAASRTAVPSR
jgi:hypothetical protein